MILDEIDKRIPLPREEESSSIADAIEHTDINGLSKMIEDGVKITPMDVVLSIRTFIPSVMNLIVNSPGIMIPRKAIRMALEFFVRLGGGDTESKIIQKMLSLPINGSLGIIDKQLADNTQDAGIIKAMKKHVK